MIQINPKFQKKQKSMESQPEKHHSLLDANQTESNTRNLNIPLSFWFPTPTGYGYPQMHLGSNIVVPPPNFNFKQHFNIL